MVAAVMYCLMYVVTVTQHEMTTPSTLVTSSLAKCWEREGQDSWAADVKGPSAGSSSLGEALGGMGEWGEEEPHTGIGYLRSC